VPLSTIEDDFYVFDEMRRNLVGRRTRRVIRLGDRLEVQVAKVDSAKKQVDFCLAVETGKPGAQRPAASRQFAQRPQSPSPRPQQRQQPSRPDQKREQPSHWKKPQSRPQEARPARPQSSSQPQPQPHWKKDRRPESRPARPQGESTRPARPQREEARPAIIKSSATQFSTTQRPLIKSSGSNRFQKRRR
jgi:ribonuclease R